MDGRTDGQTDRHTTTANTRAMTTVHDEPVATAENLAEQKRNTT